MLFKKGEVTNGALRCEILKPVSKGRMSELYLARLQNTEHKLMVKAAGKDGLWQRNLKQEALLMSGLRLNGIPEMLDFVEEQDRSYFIMSYHEGITLTQYIERYCQISQQTVMKIAKSVCRILMYLHDREIPIIHSDIKPANILLQKNEVVLLDFGVAQTLTGQRNNTYFQGTLGYAAPECWQKSFQVCPATDIFALGATLYCLLEGREPIQCFGKYELSDCSENKKNRWQPVLKRCTALDIQNRYRSVAQLYNDLNKITF